MIQALLYVLFICFKMLIGVGINEQILQSHDLKGVSNLKESRVKQILSSAADIEVKYNGASIWIDNFNEHKKTATVHLRGPLNESSVVDIDELMEE